MARLPSRRPLLVDTPLYQQQYNCRNSARARHREACKTSICCCFTSCNLSNGVVVAGLLRALFADALFVVTRLLFGRRSRARRDASKYRVKNEQKQIKTYHFFEYLCTAGRANKMRRLLRTRAGSDFHRATQRSSASRARIGRRCSGGSPLVRASPRRPSELSSTLSLQDLSS